MLENFHEWLQQKDAELFDKLVANPLNSLVDVALSIVPDLVGYATLGGAAFIFLNAMMGKSIAGPLGFIASILIFSTSILAVS